MAKSRDERQRDAQIKDLMKVPDPMKRGNRMSDVTLSNDAFYREVHADRNVRPIESIQGDFAKCRENLKPRHKGDKQL